MITTTLALPRFRLRPVRWGWLAVLATGWFLLTELLAAVPHDPQVSVVVVRCAALLLGLGGVVLAAPETDPPREVLRAAPVPRWRTLALRLAGWLALGALAVLTLAVRLDGTAGWTAADLVLGGLPNFLLATAAGFLAANLTSVLGGGAAAMAAIVGLDTAGRAWPAGFPVQLRSVPGAPHWQASRVWMVGLSLALMTVALLLEARAGTRVGLPQRRCPMARPSPASQARARP
jgi:hypothetical protein